MNLKTLLDNFSNFSKKRENLFFVLAFSFFPLLSIARLLVRSFFSTESSAQILLIITFLTFVALAIMILYYEQANQFFFQFFTRSLIL